MGNNKTILVTGATGRVGSRLIPLLIDKGYTVKALAERKELVYNLASGVIPVVGRIENLNVLRSNMGDVDYVIHLASIVQTQGVSNKAIIDTNVTGTRNVALACEENGIKQLIYTSSIDVYGIKRKEVLNEQTMPRPVDRYGMSKLQGELQIINVNKNTKYTIFRISTIYGPGFESSFFKVFKALEEGKMVIIGDGKNHLALVHINDVLKAILLSINNKSAYNEIFNLSDGNEYTQEGLLDLAADLLKVPRPNKHISPIIAKLIAKSGGISPDELRFLMSDRKVDISKIKEYLGFKPDYSIWNNGIELVNEYKEFYR